MVKSGKRKFVKKEKAKVHLKVSHKTLLPKGQNVTDTNFKVRKIVLHGQLKERGEHEILSKGNLNIKVCTKNLFFVMILNMLYIFVGIIVKTKSS